MELAEALHHSVFKGAGPETNDASRSQRTANSKVDSVLFDLYDEDTAGLRPTGLVEPRGSLEGFSSTPCMEHADNLCCT